MSSIAALVVPLLAAAGCRGLSIKDGTLACSAKGECPGGFLCGADRKCWRMDGGASDAGASKDAPADPHPLDGPKTDMADVPVDGADGGSQDAVRCPNGSAPPCLIQCPPENLGGPKPRDCASPLDNDCDGVPDNSVDAICKCAVGAKQICNMHPGADGKGPCQAGGQTCVASTGSPGSDWGPCTGAVAPAAMDLCTTKGDDSNCNGQPNDGCPCVDGEAQPCGPANPQGICKAGVVRCQGQRWTACDATFPATRDCSSSADNDCDGKPDNMVDSVCQCAVGTSQACQTHPGLDGHGACQAGAQSCVASANKTTSAWGACAGAVGPGGRDCTSSLDNDCNGVADNAVDATCKCQAGSMQACDTHPGSDGKGSCQAGSQSCTVAADKKSSNWGACSGSVGPAPADSCTIKGNDANCNGQPNDGCPCVEGEPQACGPPNPKGICKAGVAHCVNQQFTGCDAIFPGARDCTSANDNDCDGKPDNTVDGFCRCAVGTSQACQGHPGLDGHGPCQAGSQTCAASADKTTSAWGACSGSVGPGTRDCTSSLDNDCSGQPDNTTDGTCVCAAGSSQPCQTHPGQDGHGPCKAGSQSCAVAPDKHSSNWGVCSGSVGPAAADTCDANNDNNCNGTFHDGCICVNGQTQGCGNCGTQTCTNGNWGACGGECQAPRPTCSGGVCVCQGTICNNQCVNTSNDKQNCGGCNNVCSHFGTTATCSNSTCAYQCTNTSHAALSCSTSTAPSCGSWDFESGTLEGWRHEVPSNSECFVGSLDPNATAHAYTGTHSLAVRCNFPFNSNGFSTGILALQVPLCANNSSILLGGATFRFRILAVVNSGPPLLIGNDTDSLGLFFHATNSSNGSTDGIHLFNPDGNGWTTFEGHLPGDGNSFDAAGFYIQIGKDGPTSGSWDATFYIDDVQIF
ncbi:MAG TPA: hypothetical protein VH374_17950 [Polyangia bacterium]|nr:hypothetical protein [Polyangia bacterium]